MAMSEMAAVREIHAENGIAGLQRRDVNRNICLRARMRLNVGMLGAENLLRAIDRQALHAIYVFAAAVISFARIAFRVFIRENRAHRFHYGAGDEIF